MSTESEGFRKLDTFAINQFAKACANQFVRQHIKITEIQMVKLMPFDQLSDWFLNHAHKLPWDRNHVMLCTLLRCFGDSTIGDLYKNCGILEDGNDGIQITRQFKDKIIDALSEIFPTEGKI